MKSSNRRYSNLPVLKSTKIGAPDIGQARHSEGWAVPGCRRAWRAVCCRVTEEILVPCPTSHNESVLSVAAERRRWPHFDQLTLVIEALDSLCRSSFATPRVSKSQITHAPSVHPAANTQEVKAKTH